MTNILTINKHLYYNCEASNLLEAIRIDHIRTAQLVTCLDSDSLTFISLKGHQGRTVSFEFICTLHPDTMDRVCEFIAIDADHGGYYTVDHFKDQYNGDNLDHKWIIQKLKSHYHFEVQTNVDNQYSHIDITGQIKCSYCSTLQARKLAICGHKSNNLICENCDTDLNKCNYSLYRFEIDNTKAKQTELIYTWSSPPIIKNNNIFHLIEELWPKEYPNISQCDNTDEDRQCFTCKGTGVFTCFQWADPCSDCNGSGIQLNPCNLMN